MYGINKYSETMDSHINIRVHSCIEKYRKPNSCSAKVKFLKTIKYQETRVHEMYAPYLWVVCVPLFPFGHVHMPV